MSCRVALGRRHNGMIPLHPSISLPAASAPLACSTHQTQVALLDQQSAHHLKICIDYNPLAISTYSRRLMVCHLPLSGLFPLFPCRALGRLHGEEIVWFKHNAVCSIFLPLCVHQGYQTAGHCISICSRPERKQRSNQYW